MIRNNLIGIIFFATVQIGLAQEKQNPLSPSELEINTNHVLNARNGKWLRPERITASSIRKLPEDLKTETILFLKFDSIDLPDKRPKDYDKALYIKRKHHNKSVPKLNKELYKSAKKYPFPYKIVSMTDRTNFSARNLHNAKYLFYMNSFDAFHDGVIYYRVSTQNYSYVTTANSPSAEIMLGIVDLQSRKTYLISRNIGISQTYKYGNMIFRLRERIRKQFEVEGED